MTPEIARYIEARTAVRESAAVTLHEGDDIEGVMREHKRKVEAYADAYKAALMADAEGTFLLERLGEHIVTPEEARVWLGSGV